jgi:hypothetical protein
MEYNKWLNLVRKDWRNLEVAPKKFKNTFKIGLSAVQQTEYSFKYASLEIQEIIAYRQEIFKTYMIESILKMLISEQQIKPIYKMSFYDIAFK